QCHRPSTPARGRLWQRSPRRCLGPVESQRVHMGRLPISRSEEHTSELQYVAISYAVFCLKKKKWSSIGAGKLTPDVLTGGRHTCRVLTNGGPDFYTPRKPSSSSAALQFEALA